MKLKTLLVLLVAIALFSSAQAVKVGCSSGSGPVCGVDGKTYDDECVLEEANIPKAYNGECVKPCENNGGCKNGKKCVQGECVTAACGLDTECGAMTFLAPYCLGESVFSGVSSGKCNNPGKQNASCSTVSGTLLVKQCEEGCSNNKCNEDAGVLNPQLVVAGTPIWGFEGRFDSANTIDFTTQLQQALANCIPDASGNCTITISGSGVGDGTITLSNLSINYGNESMVCKKTEDCGTADYVGLPYCDGKVLKKTKRSFTCLNAGSTNSSCQSNDTEEVVTTCGYKCEEGACVEPIACYKNEDCGYTGPIGDVYCDGQNLSQMNEINACGKSGTENAFCDKEILPITVELCEFGCEAGKCNEPEGLALYCPTTPIKEDYVFNWSRGQTTGTAYLEYSYNDFKSKGSIYTRETEINISSYYNNFIYYESKSANKKINLRIKARENNKYVYSNVCEVELKQPTAPVLECPTEPIDETYTFNWQQNDFTYRNYLYYGYDPEFGSRTYSNNYINGNSFDVKNYYKNMMDYENKSTNKKLYAKIYAYDKSNRKTYSNVCEFTLKERVKPTLQCPTEKIGKSYAFEWNAGDYTKYNYLYFSYKPDFSRRLYISDSSSPTEISSRFSSLENYTKRSSDGKLYAKLSGRDNYNGTGYSNICTFELDLGTIMCSKNSDCGTDTLIGGKYCKGGHVYQSEERQVCSNAGTYNSSCSKTTGEKKMETCSNGCSNGACNSVNIECYKDSGCGEKKTDGTPYCSNGKVAQRYIDHGCAYPGTEKSKCTTYYTIEYTDCPNGCESGACTESEGLSLVCPTTPIGQDYIFNWNRGQTSGSAYLEYSYNDFKSKGSIYARETEIDISRYYKNFIYHESKSSDGKIRIRIKARENNKYVYSNVCEVELKQPTAPVLECPTNPIDETYTFNWQQNDFTYRNYLYFGYDPKFSSRTYKSNYANGNKLDMKNYYRHMLDYTNKSPNGKLYAKIYAYDKSNRKTYSNVCEFELKPREHPALECPTAPIDKNYKFNWSAGDYSKYDYIQFSYKSSFSSSTSLSVKSSPAAISSRYSTLESYERKASGGTLYARLYGRDAYSQTAYSKVCEFKLV